MPPTTRKRKAQSSSKTDAADDESIEDTSAAKRTKTNLVENLVCPITLALPFNPVIAEDGRTYEHAAVAKHISQKLKSAAALKSPITNVTMGPVLVPNHQAKSLIESLIDNGDIDGEMAAAWKKKREDKKKFDKLITKAENGDPEAMRYVARAYRFGEYGVITDNELAKQWYKRASDAGDIQGMASYGINFLCGRTEQTSRMALLGCAAYAGGGSDLACLTLGQWYAEGSHGLEVNKPQAVRLLRKGLGLNNDAVCAGRHASQSFKERCKTKLHELEAIEVGTDDEG